MMRKVGICLLLFLTVSCVEIAVKTTIIEDGSGTQNWQITTTALLAGEVRKKIENDPFFKKNNAKITEEFKEGDYILKAEIPFQKVGALQEKDHELHLEQKGFFKKTYAYTETWKRDVNPNARLLWKGAGSMVPLTLKISIELPGKIIESNADVVENNVAQWNISVGDIVDSKTLLVQSTQWNRLVLIPLGIVILMGAGTVVLLIARRPRANALCNYCGAVVPGGSTFCKDCGAKL